MNKKKVFTLTVILATLTTIIAYFYISNLKKEVAKEEQIERVQLVTVSSTIPAYVQLSEDMLEMKAVPVESIPPSAVKTLEEAVGEMTTTELIAGEPILKERLMSNKSSSLLSYRIPEMMRAITIPTDEIVGLAGYVVPGDHVDMMVSYDGDLENPENVEGNVSDKNTKVYTQIQNIEVLAIGPYKSVNEPEEFIPSSLTLLVSPEQAEVVAYANQRGAVHLTLRNPADTEKETLDGYGDSNFDNWKER